LFTVRYHADTENPFIKVWLFSTFSKHNRSYRKDADSKEILVKQSAPYYLYVTTLFPYPGPCHENQNCIATHESNGLDIITALILNDINPLGKTRMDLVLELKNNASKLLLAIMESRNDSENNAERILYNMNPKQLVSNSSSHYYIVKTGKPVFT
jgi:hypothetical protein